jgi:D-glycero-D-manno-heptose 1,7-bisphosphate phosphatase
VGRGEISLKEVEAFHQKLLQVLNIHGIQINLIAICPHTPWDNCLCRKPQPGMLSELVRVSKIQNRNRIFFIGDKDSDMEAAKNAGIRGFKSDAVNFLGICESIKILLSND